MPSPVDGLRGEMIGPRTRRRLAYAAVVLGLVGAIVAAVVLLTRSSKSPAAAVAPGSNAALMKKLDKLVPGMKETQVRRIAGPPAKVVGSCWEYDPHYVNHVFGQTHTLDAERICFFEGLYAVQYTRWEGQDVWSDGSGHTLTNPTH